VNKRTKLAVVIIALVLILDQIFKIYIKTNYRLGDAFHVFNSNWFIIKFIENNGMAFGLEFGGEWGKILLSLFRLIAVGAIIYYLAQIIKKKAPWGLIISVSLIIAGAFGNIVDSLFYGMIFTESTEAVKAVIFPEGGGYSGFLHGKVVDMLYFPILKGHYPAWSPINPGAPFEFFRPVFNLADSAITVGVFMIFIWQKRYFKDLE
jgi:signal peptidase II